MRLARRLGQAGDKFERASGATLPHIELNTGTPEFPKLGSMLLKSVQANPPGSYQNASEGAGIVAAGKEKWIAWRLNLLNRMVIVPDTAPPPSPCNWRVGVS